VATSVPVIFHIIFFMIGFLLYYYNTPLDGITIFMVILRLGIAADCPVGLTDRVSLIPAIAPNWWVNFYPRGAKVYR